MKTHEITTSKGEFVVMDYNYNTHRQDLYSLDIDIIERVGYINNITEEQASDIVDEYLYNTNSEEGDCEVYEDYTTGDICFTSPLESLHSLLKSKGIDLNNGNWYLFKKI